MSDTLAAANPATNPHRSSAHGSFRWYELLTTDTDAAKRFYERVIGWSSEVSNPGEEWYTLFKAGEEPVAGMMKLPGGGMNPGWLGYIGVDDVDEAVAKLTAAGGSVHKPAWDMPGVGRMALVADPQGIVFYVMRGDGSEPSPAFKPMADGHGAWNELVTTDQAAALDFYIGQFGWEKGDVMPMGEMGDYQFINQGGEMIGAVMNRPDNTNSIGSDQPPMWNYYFRVPSIDKAVETVRGNGGTITFGPQEVPGDDFVINAIDPQGAAFGLVGAEK